ncbi:UNVERIFIED_CONTAM: Serine/threonine-protein kinase ATM [Sesamum calycinum]|uniref:Serine/threonine-protein kinase ATM n=1 Tax=Sesamum calycinum TaxID=2727403 RepID=A0AAW2K9Y8_9LAMI
MRRVRDRTRNPPRTRPGQVLAVSDPPRTRKMASQTRPIRGGSGAGFPGKNLPLLPVARLLFSHVWDVLKDVPIFQSDHFLKTPPGDIPDELREDMIKGFVGIFSHVRDEGKIARKLVECINVYLSKDGPNLGCKSLEIHEAVQQFVFRCWFATHDRTLKDALVCYVKLQLSLTRGVADGTALLEQLLDVVSKELDQMSTYSPSVPRNDSTRDVKCGLLTSSQLSIVELAALVFCRVLTGETYLLWLLKLNSLRHSALCCLIRYYSTRVKKDLFISWFLSISTNFERIINNVNLEHSYDGLFWTLRSLHRLYSLLLFAAESAESSLKSSFLKNEVDKGWHVIWSCLMRSLPTFVNVTSIVDAALTLLCTMILSVRS